MNTTNTLEPDFETLPHDGKLYRLYHAGTLIPPIPENLTPRIGLYFKEVNKRGEYIANRPVVSIFESVGAIPKMPLGSYWCDGQTVEMGLHGDEVELAVTISAPEDDRIYASGAAHPSATRSPGDSRRHSVVNPSDVPLAMTDLHGRRIQGHDAFVALLRTVDNTEVIIPGYECFRGILACRSDLALDILSRPWEDLENDWIDASQVIVEEADGLWIIPFRNRETGPSVSAFTRLYADPRFRREVQRVYTQQLLLSRKPATLPWLACGVPLVGNDFQMRIIARKLRSRNALYVHKITAIEYSGPIREIIASLPPEIVIEGIDGPADVPVTATTPTATNKAYVGVPVDGKNTKSAIRLINDTPEWISFPKPELKASSTKVAPQDIVLPVHPKTNSVSVSLGKPSGKGTKTRAEFSPINTEKVRERFSALMTTLELLTSEGQITSSNRVVLVNPLPKDDPSYCGFPNPGNTWCVVSADGAIRQRLALVLELIYSGRRFYWIDSEVIGDENGTCALVFCYKEPGQLLTEPDLKSLLAIGANHRGIWRDEALNAFASRLYWVKQKHISDSTNRAWTRNTVIGAFNKLTRLGTCTIGDRSAEGVNSGNTL